MNNTDHGTAVLDTPDYAHWPIAGVFLQALARRDFPALEACLDPDVRFRALVPSGPFELAGSADTIARLRRWFGGDDGFEVVDASISEVGSRLYLRWRVRLRSVAEPHKVRIVEQHAFATTGERIESLDLLCSGFHTEP